MEFDVQKSFGYPVLRTLVQGEGRGELADYPKMNFHPSISAPKYNLKTDPDHFFIEYDLGMRKPKCLLDAIDDGNASAYMYVLCRKSFYSKIKKLKETKGEIKFEQKLFRYNVEMSVYIIANKKFDLVSDEFHPDFDTGPFAIKQGDVLAWSYPDRTSVEKTVYRSMKSVFSYSESDEVENGSYFLKTDDDGVAITVSPTFLEKIRVYEATQEGKNSLRASLFVPAVIELLHLLKNDAELPEDHIWASVLFTKCKENGFDLDNIQEYAKYAQKLLSMPLKDLIWSD